MSAVILSEKMKKSGSSDILIQLVKDGSAASDLDNLSVGICAPGQSVIGTYDPASDEACVFVPESKYIIIRAHMNKKCARLLASVTYETSDNRVTRFDYRLTFSVGGSMLESVYRFFGAGTQPARDQLNAN